MLHQFVLKNRTQFPLMLTFFTVLTALKAEILAITWTFYYDNCPQGRTINDNLEDVSKYLNWSSPYSLKSNKDKCVQEQRPNGFVG